MNFIVDLIEATSDRIFPKNTPRYFGLAKTVEDNQVIGEPCIGPKTNYYRIPVFYGRDIVGNGAYFVNCKPLFWNNANCNWGELWYWFVAETADQPVSIFYSKFASRLPIHIGCGDTAGFHRGDLEIEFFIE